MRNFYDKSAIKVAAIIMNTRAPSRRINANLAIE